MTKHPLNLLDLADRLDECAEGFTAKSYLHRRMRNLADAARELDDLRFMRRHMDAMLFRTPLSDIEAEAESVRENVRDYLQASNNMRELV